MTNYRVGWEIDIEAETPEDAARQALRIQRDPDSMASVFDVTGERVDVAGKRIDLQENEDTTLIRAPRFGLSEKETAALLALLDGASTAMSGCAGGVLADLYSRLLGGEGKLDKISVWLEVLEERSEHKYEEQIEHLGNLVNVLHLKNASELCNRAPAVQLEWVFEQLGEEAAFKKLCTVFGEWEFESQG